MSYKKFRATRHTFVKPLRLVLKYCDGSLYVDHKSGPRKLGPLNLTVHHYGDRG